MPTAYANNELTEEMIPALAGAINDSMPNWALVDCALVPKSSFLPIASHRGWRVIQGYSGSDLAAFGDAGVFLIQLDADADIRFQQISQLLRIGNPAPGVTWLKSHAMEHDLKKLCAYLGMANVKERKQPVHCRFADARVLPMLLAQLTAEQSQRVAQAVEQWIWVDRGRATSQWTAPDSVGGIQQPDPMPNLHLSVAQFRAMREAGEVDGIFTLLWEQTPSLVPRPDVRGDFHDHLVRILETASAFNVHDLKSRLQFAVLSLSCGDDFHTVEALQPTWEGVRAGEYLMVEKMPLWGNEVWETLEYRRPEEERGVLP